MSDYIVKPGDTLWGIAQANGTTVQAILEANPQITNPDLIHPGDTLRLISLNGGPITREEKIMSEAGRPALALPSGEYNMDHPERGIALVINIMNFNGQPRMTRHGSEKDVESISDTLKYLGFQVTTYLDKTALEIVNILKKVANMDHSNKDCFVCVVMSHGEMGGIVARDRQIVSESDMCEPFKETRSLNGKPKLFFIQACRGHIQMDHDASSLNSEANSFFRSEAIIESDSINYKPPREADFLIHYATVLTYVSYRNPINGSIFIQTLSKALREKAEKESLLEVLTCVVNNETAAMHLEDKRYVQMSEIKQRLRGRIIFKSKRNRTTTSTRQIAKEYYANGQLKYEGEIRDGKYNGQGKFYYKNGEWYEGEFRNGMYNGIGKFHYKTGGWHEGNYKDDNRYGQGKEYYANGQLKYEGEFRDGGFNGKGTFYWENGEWYDGEWKDNTYHGHGTFY